MAAGLHIAGGGDEYHRALKLFEQRAINKLNGLTVRQIVVQQQQTWLMKEDQFAGLFQRSRDSHDAQMEVLLNKLPMQLCEMWLILNNNNLKRADISHGKVLSKEKSGTG